MKKLVLFYVDKSYPSKKLLVTEYSNDIHKYRDVDVILQSNAYDINCYLLKYELEISNPEVLKVHLDKLRNGEGIICVGDFWRSVKLKKGVNKKVFNIIITSYLNFQLDASRDVNNAIRTDSLRAKCRDYVSNAIGKINEEVQDNMLLTANRINHGIYTVKEAEELMIR
jgi:hypothetical protein